MVPLPYSLSALPNSFKICTLCWSSGQTCIGNDWFLPHIIHTVQHLFKDPSDMWWQKMTWSAACSVTLTLTSDLQWCLKLDKKSKIRSSHTKIWSWTEPEYSLITVHRTRHSHDIVVTFLRWPRTVPIK